MAGVKGKSGGRNKKPDKLKVIQGTFDKSRAIKPAVDPNVAIPEMPDGLPPEAVEVWHWLTEKLYTLNAISELDGPCLAGFCMAQAIWDRCRKNVAKYGPVFKDPVSGQLKENPFRYQMRRVDEERRWYMQELGLTWASRARIPAKPDADDKKKKAGGVL